MTGSNDNNSADVHKAFDKLETAMADFVRGFTNERTRNAELSKENGELKTKTADAEKALNDEKAARKADNESVIARIGRISALLGGAAAVILLLALSGHISFPAGNTRQQVADNSPQLAKIEKAVDESRKDAKDAKDAANSLLGNVQTLATAVGQIARDQKPAAATPAAITKKPLPGNWGLLKVDEQLYYLIETCTPVDPGWQNFDEKGYKSLVRMLKIMKLDQAQAEQFVQTSCKVVDFKVTGFRMALDTNNPNADEDAAAERERLAAMPAVMRGDEEAPEATNTQYSPPSPWIQPGRGYPRSGPVCNRPGCNDPRHVHGHGRGKGRAFCKSGTMTSQGCKHTITDRAQLARISPPKATDPNCNGNSHYWTTAEGPYGLMRVRRVCVY